MFDKIQRRIPIDTLVELSRSWPKSLAARYFLCTVIGWFASQTLLMPLTLSAADPEVIKRPIRSVKDVVYREVGDVQVKADVYRPDDDKKRAAVLMIHGGAWSSGDKWNLSDHAREIAQEGYVAISINYRLAPRWKYPAQIEDCREALRWLVDSADKYGIDTARIAVYGYSAGGHLAALLATDTPPQTCKIRAAVAGGAPCDFQFIPEESIAVAHVMGGTRQQIPQVYLDASPTSYASHDDCPTFFFHGTADAIVPIEASRALAQRLQKLGVEVSFLEVPDQGHLITFLHNGARRAAIEFLHKHLKQDP